ncbi:MAG: dihydropteroate synthase, partial [Pseudomonadota bacterium]
MQEYFRPIPNTDLARPATALSLAGTWCWFDRVEVISRESNATPHVIAAHDVPANILEYLTTPRATIAGLDFAKPKLMGILN